LLIHDFVGDIVVVAAANVKNVPIVVVVAAADANASTTQCCYNSQ